MIDVVVPSPARVNYPLVFEPAWRFLVGGLEDLGLQPNPRFWDGAFPRPAILIAPHLYENTELRRVPDHVTFYNFEPLGRDGVTDISPDDLSAIASHRLWDYSKKNVDEWSRLGAHACHVPVGYHALLAGDVSRNGPFEHDVLFYGGLNHRRVRILKELADRGLKVHSDQGWGPDLERMLSSTRLVVNIHYFQAGIMEVVRLSQLWANRVPVVTEVGVNDETFFNMEEVCLNASYHEFVDFVFLALQGGVDLQGHADSLSREFARRAAAAEILSSVINGAFAP